VLKEGTRQRGERKRGNEARGREEKRKRQHKEILLLSRTSMKKMLWFKGRQESIDLGE
jgi:hypothetical protein